MQNKQVILLVGAARHSTHVVSHVLNYDNAYRDMLEPFSLRGEPGMFNFTYWTYIPSNRQSPEFLELATAILSGKVKNPWVDRWDKHKLHKGILVRELRAHLWLGWLHTNFPDLRLILLLRHPCAVVSSRLIFEWRSHLHQILSQSALMAEHLDTLKPDIERARSPLERHCFTWCIQHYVPLRQFAKGEIHLAFFENFLAQPEIEIQRLFCFVKGSIDDQVLAAAQRQMDSSGVTNATLDAWRKHLSAEDVRRCVDILRLFGLDAVYDDGPTPNASAALALLSEPKQQ